MEKRIGRPKQSKEIVTEFSRLDPSEQLRVTQLSQQAYSKISYVTRLSDEVKSALVEHMKSIAVTLSCKYEGEWNSHTWLEAWSELEEAGSIDLFQSISLSTKASVETAIRNLVMMKQAGVISITDLQKIRRISKGRQMDTQGRTFHTRQYVPMSDENWH